LNKSPLTRENMFHSHFEERVFADILNVRVP